MAGFCSGSSTRTARRRAARGRLSGRCTFAERRIDPGAFTGALGQWVRRIPTHTRSATATGWAGCQSLARRWP
jgi:hypothetical protein